MRNQRNAFWEKYGIFIFFAVFSALLLSVCSMCSFLFPIHDRVDQNVFFTVGREILNGKVIYRDLFEHKGPLTYFIHAAAALISETSFLGVYLIEIVSLTVFLIFAYKTALFFYKSPIFLLFCDAPFRCAALFGMLPARRQCGGALSAAFDDFYVLSAKSHSAPAASKSETAVVRCDFLKRTAFRIGIVD